MKVIITARNADIGNKVGIYVTNNGVVSEVKTDKIFSCSIVADYYEVVDGVADKNNIQSKLIAWNQTDEGAPRPYYTNRNLQRPAPGYSYDIDEYDKIVATYNCFTWMSLEAPVLIFSKYGEGPIISPILEKFEFISGKNILEGDTVIWTVDHDNLINYGFVENISQDEDEDDSGTPVRSATIRIYCQDGRRSYPYGYPLTNDKLYLLVSRTKKGT